MRARTVLLAIVILLSIPAFAPARAAGPLAVDAGDSRVAYDGASLPLAGSVAGGVEPYTYAWSWNGDPARIVDAAARVTSLDTSGLPPQDAIVTLTVTDANGAVASDTVRHRIETAPIIARRTVAITFGVPDEFVSDSSMDHRVFPFTVPAGLARMVAVLNWNNTAPVSNDWDLQLVDPAGNVVADTDGSQRKPESLVIQSPAPGGWTARVRPVVSGQATGNLTIQGFPLGPLPAVTPGGPYRFGLKDTQTLAATATQGATLTWDLDQDGVFEATGSPVVASLPVGVHQVRIRATDASGFRGSGVASVEVRPVDTILRMRCGNDVTTPLWAMEFTSTKGSCWIHGGHHTYFTGDVRYAVRSVTGYVFTVEQQFTPPTEHSTTSPGTTPIHLQVSEDGLAWTELPAGEYVFAGLSMRQRVDFAAQANGESFRFVRVHEPLSAAQGLSGYLDHSELDVEADILGVVPAPAVAPGTRSLSCETDILEDFFVAHPCWFGGINRYDAPSFWHTYPVGDGATLDRIRGEFTLLPWRLDDWNQGNATTNATGIKAFVQVSVDGVNWRDVATIQSAQATPTSFDVTLADEPARFVRLFPEYHARYDQTSQFAPNHHPKGYFVDSSIVVDGELA